MKPLLQTEQMIQPSEPSPELQLVVDVGVEVADTEAEGPGRRYAIWVQGCPMRCPGCCNPELLPFTGTRSSVSATPRTVAALLERVLAAHARTPLEGISLLGGEPFAQAPALAVLAERARDAGLGVMVYSGYRLAELEAKIAADEPGVAHLLAATDLLVDGRYERERPDNLRRWIGSTNQQLHFRSDRYRADDPVFRTGETIELRLVDGELVINGWPWGKGLPWKEHTRT